MNPPGVALVGGPITHALEIVYKQQPTYIQSVYVLTFVELTATTTSTNYQQLNSSLPTITRIFDSLFNQAAIREVNN